MIKHAIHAVLFAFAIAAANAQNTPETDELIPDVSYPKLPKTAAEAKGFVPLGWAMEELIVHDLNKDGAEDLIMLLRSTDPKLVITHGGLGENPLNSNPRILAVALRNKAMASFSLALANSAIIPRHVEPTVSDPFGDIEVRNGVIHIRVGFFANAGSWIASSANLAFRHQHRCFRLIGYDRLEFHRATGDDSEVSINTLTGSALLQRTSGESGKTLKRRQTLKTNPKLCLETLGSGLELDTEAIFGVPMAYTTK